MPSGWDNNCEDEFIDDNSVVTLKTKPEVLHAESNALAKVARSTNSSEGSSIFVTHAPCLDCAKLIYQSGISSVYYRNSYRNDDGLNFLKKCNLHIEKV
jgi:dCMP deaminase